MVCDLFDDFSKMYTKFTSHTEPILCDVYVYLKGVSSRGASLMILAMTLERFYALYFPFSYKNKISVNVLTAVAAACIVPTLISCAIVTMVVGNENGYCFDIRSGVNALLHFYIVVESAVIYNIIPAALVAVFNLLIVCKIKRRQHTDERFVERQLPEFESFSKQ